MRGRARPPSRRPAGTPRRAGRCVSSIRRRDPWVIGSNERIDSTSSPNSSMRTGPPVPGGQASTRPPRCANSPTPVTSTDGSYPPATSRSSSVRCPIRSPTRTVRRAAASCCGPSVRCTSASSCATTTRPRGAEPRSASTARRSADSSCSGSAARGAARRAPPACERVTRRPRRRGRRRAGGPRRRFARRPPWRWGGTCCTSCGEVAGTGGGGHAKDARIRQMGPEGVDERGYATITAA